MYFLNLWDNQSPTKRSQAITVAAKDGITAEGDIGVASGQPAQDGIAGNETQELEGVEAARHAAHHWAAKRHEFWVQGLRLQVRQCLFRLLFAGLLCQVCTLETGLLSGV